MKIIYNENPLKTVVELDNQDRQILKLEIEKDFLQEMICGAHYHLERNEYDKAKDEIDWDYWFVDKSDDGQSNYEKTINQRFDACVDALKDTHIGDCTAFPSTCIKCLAEYYLVIRTIDRLSKHDAYKLFYLFEKHQHINEALKCLETELDETLSNDNQRKSREYLLEWLQKYNEMRLQDMSQNPEKYM